MQTTAARCETVRRFRDRLIEVIERSELSQTAFAHAVGIDRSTLSQLLSPGNERLPRIESVVAIAQVCKVSLDWLLGLRDVAERDPGVISDVLGIERDAPSPVDDRLVGWLDQAAGYKIRHVPTTFPDVLKTSAVINFEYEEFLALSPQRRMEISQSRLDYLRRPETEMEACTPVHMLESFARGDGRWIGLDPEVRREQLDQLIRLTDELYPRFRWYLFSGKQVFSVPVTIFGPIRAAIYVGRSYFVFNARDHVRELTLHFDALIRAAVVQPTEIGGFVARLREEIG
ncbi:MAG TPA: helix-turn-helix transcriptional regulator [Acetobacteraceae bacterium]|nr:helix-turn-helix transcriptional regulator [Acetobacteraceae bacterium]